MLRVKAMSESPNESDVSTTSSESKKEETITVTKNPLNSESLQSIENWGNISFTDISKYFKSEANSLDSLPNVRQAQFTYGNSTPSDSSNYGSSEYELQDSFALGSSIENLNTIINATDGSNDESNEKVEKIRRSARFTKWLNKVGEMQWSKIVGMTLVLSGVIIAVLAATISAIVQERHSKHNKLNDSIFGKQYRHLVGIRSNMVDFDTPNDFKSWKASDGDDWVVAFSDEFNCEGRTFYQGDDQFWEAVDIHYAATDNMEWLDPSHITTKEGTLRITMSNEKSHNLNFTSGMLQSWNKICFTQGYVEASIKMPAAKNSSGLWPAFWSLGNLARAGYMASTEGTWPYSYEACDVGVTPNQSSSDGLSHLPGQKLNSCICNGEDHPNPGTARSAPEIDILEGLYNDYSQTFNVAPFDIWRYPDYDHLAITNHSNTAMNDFMGTNYQEAVSAVVKSNPKWYEEGNFIKFGMEYRSDMKNRMDNYINFYVNDVLTFRITEGAFHPDGNIDWRIIPKEPMSLILNLGLSNSWSKVNISAIDFPVLMEVDYVRIYQPKDKINLSCDPKDYPTYDYINDHLNAYTNANLTTWEMAGYEFPSYSLDGKCKGKGKGKGKSKDKKVKVKKEL